MINKVIQIGNFLGICLLILSACQQPEDVNPGGRNTFIKFFGTTAQNTAEAMIASPDGGYLLLGNGFSDSSQFINLIKVNEHGNTIWQRYYHNVSGKKVMATASGYVITGDKLMTSTEETNTLALHVMTLDLTGAIRQEYTLDSELKNTKGYSLAMDQNGDVLILGTKETEPNVSEVILLALQENNLQQQWIQKYSLVNGSYRVGKSLHVTPEGALIWASTVLQLPSKSYINIPVVLSNTQGINNEAFGQNDPFNYSANDIAPGLGGYATIGTSNSSGTSNILFFRTQNTGAIVPGSERVIGGVGNDTGLALTATQDGGYILLGTKATIIANGISIGGGGDDIYLIKTDPLGNILWENTYGGTGHERGRSILETSDGGYLIFGNHELQGKSMMFLVKTNKNGALND